MKATRFEELEIWKRARMLAKSIYALVKASALSKDYGLKDQVQRAAVSVGSNIAEGFERNSNKEFVNFLFIAKGSCGEVRSQLYTAYDVGQITDAQLNEHVAICVETSKMISRFIQSLRASSVTGTRYKPL